MAVDVFHTGLFKGFKFLASSLIGFALSKVVGKIYYSEVRSLLFISKSSVTRSNSNACFVPYIRPHSTILTKRVMTYP